MVVVDTFVFCFFFIKYNHSSVDTVVYLGTGILVETIVVVDILVVFFSQLSRLCC